MIPAGSVLFSSRAPIGFVAIAGVSMCTNQGFKSAIPGPDIDKEFLYWQLQERTASIRARASGTTFLEISGKRFSATSLVVPPLTEQREIVQILEEQFSRQEASLALVDAVERKVGALRRSLLHAAFSGELTKDWREQDRG
jgi:type I restriction enzyme S subunit